MDALRPLRRRLAPVALVIACCAVPAPTGADATAPSQRAQTRAEIIKLADRHAAAGAQLQSELALQLFRGRGLSDPEIVQTYETEYVRKRPKKKDDSLTIGQLLGRYGLVLGGLLALGLILGLALRDVLKQASESALRTLTSAGLRALAGRRFIRRFALGRYHREVARSMRELQVPFWPHKSLDISRLYIAPRLRDEEGVRSPLQALLTFKRITVVGPPGSGKSIMLRRLALDFAEGSFPRIADFVVLVELRRLAESGRSVRDEIVSSLGRKGFAKADAFVDKALANGRALVLFDALDEVPSSQRSSIAQCLRDFLEDNKDVLTIVTCRDAVYSGEADAVTEATLTVAEFNDRDISRYLHLWEDEMPAGRSAAGLMATLQERPPVAAVARNPLMLTILVRLYCHVPGYSLPTSRTDFYTEAAKVLLEQWHKEQNRYNARNKLAVLRYLAKEAQADVGGDRRTIPATAAIAAAQAVLPSLGLTRGDAVPLLTEIVERGGLLLAIDAGERYQFAHLTWQEYFAAEAYQNQHGGLVELYKADPTAWREVIRFWCGLSSDSTGLIAELRTVDSELGLECLADAVQIDDALADQLIDHALAAVEQGNAAPAVEQALGSVASGQNARGATVLQRLIDGLKDATSTSLPGFARALSYTETRRAVEALSPHYGTHPAVRSALVRLGDLAVETLADRARTGTVPALDDLVRIGNPRANRTIAGLAAAEDDRLAQQAAWRAAAALSRADVLDDVRKNLPEIKATETDELYRWVTEIRHFRQPEPLRELVDRIVRLVASTKSADLPETSLEVHPAISVPLCAVACEKLRTVGGRPVTTDLIKAANALLGRDAFAYTGTGFTASYTKGAVRLAPGRALGDGGVAESLEVPPAPPTEGKTRGDLLIGVLSELAVAAADSDTKWDKTSAERLLRAYVERTGCPRHTIALLNGMPIAVKFLLLHGLAKCAAPSKHAWAGEYARPLFGPRWLYRTALGVFIIAVLASLAELAWRIAADPPVAATVAYLAIGLSVLGGTREILHAIRKRSHISARLTGETTSLAPLILLFELAAWRRGRSTVKDVLEVLALSGFSPGIILFSTLAASRAAPMAVVIVSWAVVGSAYIGRLFVVNHQAEDDLALRDVQRYVAEHRSGAAAYSSLMHLTQHLRRHRHGDSVPEPA